MDFRHTETHTKKIKPKKGPTHNQSIVQVTKLVKEPYK